MDKFKKNISNKEDDLLSEEVQEVMNRIPSAIVRWGMTVMAIIVSGLLITATYVPWPETMEFTFEGSCDGAKASITVTLSPEAVRALSHAKHSHVTLYSPVFSNGYPENGIEGIINQVSIINTLQGYTACLQILFIDANFCYTTNKFSGKMLLILSDSSLLQRMIYNVKSRK